MEFSKQIEHSEIKRKRGGLGGLGQGNTHAQGKQHVGQASQHIREPDIREGSRYERRYDGAERAQKRQTEQGRQQTGRVVEN